MQNIDSLISPATAFANRPVPYLDLSCGASLFGIRAKVKLETRLLADYQEVDAALGHNTVGAILSNLACRVALGETSEDGRMAVCLARRDNGQNVEVDLAVRHRVRLGSESYVLCYMGEHELITDEI